MPAVPTPIAVGRHHESEIADLLEELDRFLESEGVDTKLISAREITKLRKAPGQPSAIPPKDLWPNGAIVCRDGFMPLREAMGVPIAILNGYRPPDYNTAVRGHRRSRHLFFQALDITTTSAHADDEHRNRLGTMMAVHFKRNGRAHGGMGFGAYGQDPFRRGHLDYGYRRRRWADAYHWWNLAKYADLPDVPPVGQVAPNARVATVDGAPWYEVFGLPGPDFPLDAVEAIYRQLAKKCHPDRPGGDETQMRQLNAAVEAARKALA